MTSKAKVIGNINKRADGTLISYDYLLNPHSKMLWQLTQHFMRNEQVELAGILSTVVFESIIKHLESVEGISYEEKSPSYRTRIKKLETISWDATNWLEQATGPNCARNRIVHPKAGYIPVDACKEIYKYLSDGLGTNELNYEELASIERMIFPYMWKMIGGKIPAKLTKKFFDNLIVASDEYVAPLGEYLRKNCKSISNKKNKLAFTTLSRVNATSGYVWLAVLRSDKGSRARIRLPSITILFKPSGVAVYVELPGRSHEGVNFKKKYYQMLLSGEIDNYLTDEMAQSGYEFFHTWWYAEREYVGEMSAYFHDKAEFKKIKEWDDVIKDRIHETENSLDPITGNSFLIGRFYSRQECLESYKENLHEKIANDIDLLYPLLNSLYP